MIRADASERLGVGHVMRCANLAAKLRARGAQVRFVSRADPGNLIATLRSRGFEVSVIGDQHSFDEDAAQTRAAIGAQSVDWLIVDHYALDERWEVALRPAARQLLAIDDLPQRRHDCDRLLDQNARGTDTVDYRDRVPAGCELAIGARYALLDAQYVSQRASLAPRGGEVRRVLVTFGGSDPLDLTGRTLAALSSEAFAMLELDIVTGSNYPYSQRLEQAAAARPRTRVLPPQASLAPLLAAADLAIGAGGTTTWERLCLGVPAIVVCMAENQRPGCEFLAREGLIEYCGLAESMTDETLSSAVSGFMQDSARRRDMAARGQALVDGLGAARIAEWLSPTAGSQLQLRRAAPADVFLYFDWVNDAEVRRQSLDTAPIAFAGHRRWFEARLARPDSYLFVLLAGELPVGQIRFDSIDGWANVDYSVDRIFRGRGWGAELLLRGMRAMSADTRFRGEVKPDNTGSAAAFERVGFREQAVTAAGLRVFTHEALQ
ncbi:MAG: UDP-2,4-diacetamido-2,4,6-trideoxy-beta-L-altropyranose hydrolase [Pseudomonadota bacterium]